MRRSRAFMLSEQLLTITLQAGLILTLCMSFYLLTTFYVRTQQVMIARNHAERVISFMDDKIRNAGLGLWKCGSPAVIGTRLGDIKMLGWDTNGNKAYRLPISLKWHSDGVPYTDGDIPLKAKNQDSGDVLTVLYAQRDLSSGDEWGIISAFSAPVSLGVERNGAGFLNPTKLTKEADMLDKTNLTLINGKSIFKFGQEANLRSYAVMEGAGVPLYLHSLPTKGINRGKLTVKVRKDSTENLDITLPPGGELLGLECMQMFVDHRITGEGGQFVYRTLQSDGSGWGKNYNQEKGILDIYMRLDQDHNTFTVWVLATGGYDVDTSTSRPESWPKEATPSGSTDSAAKDAWLAEDNDYRHHVVYVSRASWKLNNIPSGFKWN